MLRRREDWPLRLQYFLDRAAGRPFEWGRSDCCLFACDGVVAMTGVDIAAAFRGRYRSMAGAYRILKNFAGGGIAAASQKIANEHGLAEIPPSFARRGDLVLFLGLTDGREALGLCGGDRLIAQSPSTGPQFGSMSHAFRSWRI